MRSFGRRRRRRLFDLQDGRCFYCREPMNTTGADPNTLATLDEVFPRSLGYPQKRENCVLACMTCNQRKANRMPTDEEIERLLKLLESEAGPATASSHPPWWE